MRTAWLAAMIGVTSCAGDPVEGTASSGSTDDGATSDVEQSGTSTGAAAVDEDGSGPADDASGAGADESTTDAVPADCGNGRVDADEVCDDGNEDDTDACTQLCTAPACDDGIRSGDESDVDCGGGCSPCTIGSACEAHDDCDDDSVCAEHCRLPRSCAELLAAHPELDDGDYTIALAPDDDDDSDSDSDGEPFVVRCDMDNGGWTRVSFEDFEDDVHDGWSSTDTDACNGWGTRFLGQFDQSDGVERRFDLLGIAHTEIEIRLVFLAIDSWDDEEVRVLVDDDEIWSRDCVSDEANTCGQSESHCGNPQWNDGTTPVNAAVAHTDDDATLRVEAELDQGIGDESWGIDDVAVFVR